MALPPKMASLFCRVFHAEIQSTYREHDGCKRLSGKAFALQQTEKATGGAPLQLSH
jgi:hypothetical protein